MAPRNAQHDPGRNFSLVRFGQEGTPSPFPPRALGPRAQLEPPSIGWVFCFAKMSDLSVPLAVGGHTIMRLGRGQPVTRLGEGTISLGSFSLGKDLIGQLGRDNDIIGQLE